MIINKKPRKANNPQNVSDALNPPSAPILSQHTSFDVARLSSFPIPASNLIYNQNNDLAYTYSLCNICDKGRDHKHWLCYVLKNQVLYLDTYDNRRFEISKVNPQHQNIFGDYNTFMVAEVIEPWRFSAEVMENENVPLGACNVDIIFNEIEWSKLQWGDSSILIEDSKANNNYRIKELISYKFYPNKVIAKPDIISLD